MKRKTKFKGFLEIRSFTYADGIATFSFAQRVSDMTSLDLMFGNGMTDQTIIKWMFTVATSGYGLIPNWTNNGLTLKVFFVKDATGEIIFVNDLDLFVQFPRHEPSWQIGPNLTPVLA